jgi:RNA polymerase sigma-70 factor (ECF subfamily)
VRDVPLSQVGRLSEVAERIRTETRPSARTETKSEVARLRERLPADDQMLLALRLDRKLAWTEIAQVMFHDGEVVEDAVLAKDSMRLRKRYQSVKDKLRAMAREAGLVPAADDE